MRRGPIVLVAVALAFAAVMAIATFFLTSRPPSHATTHGPPSRPDADGAARVAPGPLAAPTATETAAPATTPAPIDRPESFPPGADPSEVIATLLPAAQAGDAAAACRIALERLACDAAQRDRDATLRALQQEEDSSLRQRDRIPGAAMSDLLARRADRYATLQVALLQRSQACSRIPATLRDDGIDWLARAAAAGHPESVLRYASGQSLGFVEGLEPDESIRWRMLGDPRFEAWRRDAPVLLQRLIDAGRPEAAFVLSFAYADDATPLAGLVRDDPVEAAAMRLVLRDSSPYPVRSDPLRGLDARQRQAAMARFAALRQRLRGGRLDRRLLNDGLDPAPLSLVGVAADAPPPCQP